MAGIQKNTVFKTTVIATHACKQYTLYTENEKWSQQPIDPLCSMLKLLYTADISDFSWTQLSLTVFWTAMHVFVTSFIAILLEMCDQYSRMCAPFSTIIYSDYEEQDWSYRSNYRHNIERNPWMHARVFIINKWIEALLHCNLLLAISSCGC